MFTKSSKLSVVLPSLVVVLSASSFFFPAVMADLKYLFLAISMLLIGIPHGAIDHIISAKVYELKSSLSEQILFYFVYLGLMGTMAAIWYINSALGFFIFALITIYHFGQADVGHFRVNKNLKKALMLSRGVMIFSLIVFFDIYFTYPVITSVVETSLLNDQWILENGFALGMVLALQHPVLLLGIMINANQFEKKWANPLLDSLLICLLFFANHPVIAFSVYFALWHSYGHVLEMKEFFQSIGEKLTIKKFYRLAAPFTLLSLAGLTVIYGLADAFGAENQMVALLFVLVSVLTLPHVLVVQKMFNALKYDQIT